MNSFHTQTILWHDEQQVHDRLASCTETTVITGWLGVDLQIINFTNWD